MLRTFSLLFPSCKKSQNPAKESFFHIIFEAKNYAEKIIDNQKDESIKKCKGSKKGESKAQK